MTIQPSTRQVSAASSQNLCLRCNFLQASKHYPVAFPKPILEIGNAGLLAELLDQTL